LSPAANVETVKNQKVLAVTPKRKRMANVLDVLETIKSSSTTSRKTVETSEAKTEIFDTKAPEQETEAEAGPSELLPPKHPPKSLIILFDMLRGKSCLKKKSKRPSFSPKN
jgi:hypothetical protein